MRSSSGCSFLISVQHPGVLETMPGNLVPETVPKLFSFAFGISGMWEIGGLRGILRKASHVRTPVAHSVPDFRFTPVSSIFAPYAWLPADLRLLSGC